MKKEIPTIEVKFERVEIKPGTRKLKGKWKVELLQDILVVDPECISPQMEQSIKDLLNYEKI